MAVVRYVGLGSKVSIFGGSWAFVYHMLRCFVGAFTFPCLLVVRVRGRSVIASLRLRTFPSRDLYDPVLGTTTGTRSKFVALVLVSGT